MAPGLCPESLGDLRKRLSADYPSAATQLSNLNAAAGVSLPRLMSDDTPKYGLVAQVVRAHP